MDCIPIHYDLHIEPDLEKFTFEGTESIKVDCKKPVSTITMNCAELTIKSCQLSLLGNNELKYKINEKKEELQIKLGQKISGKIIIKLKFQGILNDRLLGFYRSCYTQKGKTKYLATTQFEAADARRAFPCWDEPAAKATFQISITADNKFMAISNMPINSTTKTKTKTCYKFKRTPKMSTYLVYFGVGEFEYISGNTRKTKIRVLTTVGNKSKGKFALNLAKKLLVSYEEYFEIKYPLPKLDLIAIPDFAAGAMENWGAITFRETILLYDPKTSSTRTKQFIAEVISHEIAHQWFGNLVTMKWWNDLWLNESFATFMATKFVDKFYPEWNMWGQFVNDTMSAAMSLDSLKSTHPIDVKVNSPSQIREIFDAISYDKGGCVLRMLEHYVGETNFRKGLKKYLCDFKYKNAEGNDLWNAIGNVSDKSVTSIMNSWLKQPGFPLVKLKYTSYSLIIRQQRFLLEPVETPTTALWSIPLIVMMDYDFDALFTTRSMEIDELRGVDKITANDGRYGFYRVQYDSGILKNLKIAISDYDIDEIDKWAIQNDLFALCMSGAECVKTYLNFINVYYDDDSYIVLINIAHNLALLCFYTFNEKYASDIHAYTIKYLSNILSKLGWNAKKSDKHTDPLLRSFVIYVLGRLNDKTVTAIAIKRYNKFLKSPNSLSPDLIEPVCSIAAWKGNEKTYQQLRTLYNNAKTMEEKLRFLGAMCGFRNKKLLVKTLDFSQTSEVRSQNIQLPIMKVAANPHGKQILWPWLQKNWNALNKKVGHGNPLFNRIISSIELVADQNMENEIVEFFTNNHTPGTERTQTQTLERIRIKSKFIKRLEKEFTEQQQ